MGLGGRLPGLAPCPLNLGARAAAEGGFVVGRTAQATGWKKTTGPTAQPLDSPHPWGCSPAPSYMPRVTGSSPLPRHNPVLIGHALTVGRLPFFGEETYLFSLNLQPWTLGPASKEMSGPSRMSAKFVLMSSPSLLTRFLQPRCAGPSLGRRDEPTGPSPPGHRAHSHRETRRVRPWEEPAWTSAGLRPQGVDSDQGGREA